MAFHGVEPYCGAHFLFWKCHGAVRCGSVRFGAFFFLLRIVRCGADFVLHGEVRCGLYFSIIVRCGAVRLSVERLFPTVRLSVHRS